MGTINRFEEIEAWQTARELSRLVYLLTREGMFARDFGLRDQIRRAAVSIMSNIAEGFESRTQPLFIEFLGRAKGSAGEVRSHSSVALDAEYITQLQFEELLFRAERCSRQISRFIDYLSAHPNASRVHEDPEHYSSDNL